MNDPNPYEAPKMMTAEEARKAADQIREAMDALPEEERADAIRFALSLGEGDAKCLKH